MRPDGTWVEMPFPSFSRAYRESRSIWDAWLFDFKQARINFDLFVARYSEEAAAAYLLYLARGVEDELGFKPSAMRMIIREVPVPPPEELGDWRPLDAPPGKVVHVEEIR
jgi:hypothetical protein